MNLQMTENKAPVSPAERPAPAPAYRSPRIESHPAATLTDLLAGANAATGFIPSP
jgi:hypothetical protein